MTPAAALDLASVFVFALTGALAASRAQLDIVGFLFFSAITAVGGGTVRDLLLDRNPVFWIAKPGILLAVAVAAVLVYFTAHMVESRARWLAWLDAAALAIAVPAGLTVAISLGYTGPIAVLMGVVTGTMGGLMRDVVANEVPMVLRQGELYVTAAAAGALLGTFVYAALGLAPALIASAAVTFGLRAGSLAFGWQLPVYRSRPPR
ncbi:MAG: TRIC cation channel family protein [Silicimonas sp.]|jgi:uncharacterized membrane protein YeiH|nr:TRIC cation channel family protein [Silicimonas sp.]